MVRLRGQVRKGCLMRQGAPVARPSKPWLIDLTLLKPAFPTVPGDIADFNEDPSFDSWRLGDTPENEQYSLSWNEIDDDGRRLLICDRVILVRVSWDDLDNAGYVSGRQVTIDGTNYICRLLSGGNDFRAANDGYQGGSPANEWDRIIGGEAKCEGLPEVMFRDESVALSEEYLNCQHNIIWNWLGAVSWTQEPYLHRETARCCRGYQSAGFFYLNTQSHRHEDIGWRPVLEPV